MVSTPASSAARTQATRFRLEEQVRDGGRRTLVRMPTSLAAAGMPNHPATYCPCFAGSPTEDRYTYSCAGRSWGRTSRSGPSAELRVGLRVRLLWLVRARAGAGRSAPGRRAGLRGRLTPARRG